MAANGKGAKNKDVPAGPSSPSGGEVSAGAVEPAGVAGAPELPPSASPPGASPGQNAEPAGKEGNKPPVYTLEERQDVVPPEGLDPRLQGALLQLEDPLWVRRVLRSAVDSEGKGGGEAEGGGADKPGDQEPASRGEPERSAEAVPAKAPAGPLAEEEREDKGPYVDVLARLDGRRVPEELKVTVKLGEICTGRVRLKEIKKVRSQVCSLKVATELRLELKYSVPEIHCTAAELQEAFPPNGLDGSDVIVGVVDIGCDFVHRNFRDDSGYTRLLYLWDQRQRQHHSAADSALPPREIGYGGQKGYGRELDAARIDSALLQPDPYASLEYTLESGSHGTHVLDIAAGNGNGTGADRAGVAPWADLIFVELAEADRLQERLARKFGTEEHVGNSRYVLEGVYYIFEKATRLRRPCVVNLSLGTYGGAHDGTTLVEMGFEWLLKEDKSANRSRAIVIAAGNAGNQGIHAIGTVRSGKTRKLRWLFHADPLAQHEEECEIWYASPAGTKEKGLEVTLVSPEGDTLGPVKPGETWEIRRGGELCGYIIHRFKDPNHKGVVNQVNIRVPVPDRSPDKKDKDRVWQIELKTYEDEIRYDAWIDDGGHSSFDDADEEKDLDGPDENPNFGPPNYNGTIGAICCSDSPIGVGAYDARTPNTVPAAMTSLGKTRDGKQKPEVSAPGVRICAASGRSHSGLFEMSGTSMAAAHVSGLCALLFQLNGNLSLDDLRRVLTRTARKTPNQGQSDGWDPRYGWGRVDGLAAAHDVQKLYGSGPPPPGPPANGDNYHPKVPAGLTHFTDASGALWMRLIPPPPSLKP